MHPVAIRASSDAPPIVATWIVLWSGGSKGKAVLDEGNAEPRTGAEAGCVCGMKEISEEEADELEGDGDQEVPKEGEDGTGGEVVDDHIIW